MRTLFLWTVALLLGQLISFLVAEARAPELPIEVRLLIGLGAGVVFGVIFSKNQSAQASAFEAARLGDRARCAALLQQRRANGAIQKLDPFGTAALEIVMGEPHAALARLQADTTSIGLAARIRKVVEAHIALSGPDRNQHAQALGSLLELGPLRNREVERYRAYLLAYAALAQVGPDALMRVDSTLAAYKDPEARAFLQWVRAHHEKTPFDAQDRLEDMRRAAELAGGHGFSALVAKILARITALERAMAQVGPYRR